MAEFNTTNFATHYHSGTDINVEGGVHYRLLPALPKFRVALQGFYHGQVTDDTVNGRQFLDGFRGRATGLGPALEYAHRRAKYSSACSELRSGALHGFSCCNGLSGF